MEVAPNKTNWGVSIVYERKFWYNYIIGIFIIIPQIFKECNKGLVYTKENNSIINPILAKCNYYKCKKEIYLRIGSIFELHNKISASVLYNILKLWLAEDKNVVQIAIKLKEMYNLHNIDNRFIYKFLQDCRISIANYIRHCYILDPLAGKNAYNHISLDESLFSHLNNKQQWVIGLINCETKDIRLEIVENRDTDTLKQIIEKNVLPGNYITTDAWKSYTFLDYSYSGYIHDVYNHARGNFNSRLSSTSRIEGLWGELKS